MQTKTKAPVKKLIETRIREYNGAETIFNISINLNNAIVRVDGSRYESSFVITEYHHCCGFKEIGNINFVRDVQLTENLEKDLLTKFLRKVTEQFVDTEASTRIGLSFTVPVNNPIGHYDRFIEAALKVGFVEVAEFTNRNSSNLLKHFIFA